MPLGSRSHIRDLTGLRFLSFVRLQAGTYPRRPVSCPGRSAARSLSQISFTVQVPITSPERCPKTTADSLASSPATTGDALSGPGLLSQPEDPLLAGLPGLHSPILSPGRWADLCNEPHVMLRESSPPTSTDMPTPLINRPENQGDMTLWACLLTYCHRTDNKIGIRYLLSELFKIRRRELFRTDGARSVGFWNLVLQIAMPDESLLQAAWLHAEYMSESLGVRWPALWSSVILHCIGEDELSRALKWHLRLSPSFGPSAQELVQVLTSATNPDPDLQDLLKALYILSRHRQLYDTLVPYLWDHGSSENTRLWRRIMVAHNDLPQSTAARPFLRFYSVFFRPDHLRDEEWVAAGLEPGDHPGAAKLRGWLGSVEPWPEQEDAVAAAVSKRGGGLLSRIKHAFGSREVAEAKRRRSKNLPYLINKAYGDAFDIPEKGYSDDLGAKWFASTWVPLDLAFGVIQTLGVDVIGPLSLQSIALRETTTAGICQRLDQLEAMGISIGSSPYAKAIKKLAADGKRELLQELLLSDIHPDVFNDTRALQAVARACILSGDWKPYRAIVAMRAADKTEATTLGFNDMVLACLRLSRRPAVFKLLNEMDAAQVPLLASTCDWIAGFIANTFSPYRQPQAADVTLCIALARRILKAGFPPPAIVWRRVLTLLAFQHRFEHMESLAVEIIKWYAAAATSDSPTVNVHAKDLGPIIMKTFSKQTGLRSNHFQALPRDIPIVNGRHPLSRVFDGVFQRCVIRWALKAELAQPRSDWQRDSIPSRDRGSPADFGIARGVRLLSVLRSVGVNVDPSLVRTAVLRLLVDLYGYHGVPKASYMDKAREHNVLTLEDARRLFNAAWDPKGQYDMLPDLPELVRQIDVAALNRTRAFDTPRPARPITDGLEEYDRSDEFASKVASKVEST